MSSVWHIGVAIARAKIGYVCVGKGTCCRARDLLSRQSRGSESSLVSHFATCATYEQNFRRLPMRISNHDKRSFSKGSHLKMPRGRAKGGGVHNADGDGNASGGGYGQSSSRGRVQAHSPHIIQARASPEEIKDFLKPENLATHSDLPPEFPSDIDKVKMQQRKRNQSRGSYRPKIDPSETSVFLFPGQGSQFVGMGKNALDIPNVQRMYDSASDILDYDLLDLCLNGPKEKLDKTIYSQPAVFVASLAAVETLKEENELAIEHCIATAGFSVGEFAALVFAGALTFEDGLEIVQQRAMAMQQASEDIPSGMMTAFLGPDNRAKMACHTAKLYCTKELGMPPEEVDCTIANFLYPECKVIAGNDQALDFIMKNSKEFGIRQTKRLAVSGAFHTRLMYPAQAVVAKALEQVSLNRPLIDVHSNVDAKRYKDVNKMRKLLTKQVCEPVKWEQIQHKIFERRKNVAFPNIFECGPGRQLGWILKMTNQKAYNNYKSVDV